MPPGNTLIGDAGVLYASDSPSEARPFAPGGNGIAAAIIPPSSTDERTIANYVAFLVLLALAVLILIRVAGLQGMIAVGRGA